MTEGMATSLKMKLWIWNHRVK